MLSIVFAFSLDAFHCWFSIRLFSVRNNNLYVLIKYTLLYYSKSQLSSAGQSEESCYILNAVFIERLVKTANLLGLEYLATIPKELLWILWNCYGLCYQTTNLYYNKQKIGNHLQ